MKRFPVAAILAAAALLAASLDLPAQAPTIPFKVIRTIPHSRSYGMGLAWDSSALGHETIWVSDTGSGIEQIDPYTGVQVKTLPAPNTKVRGLAHDGFDLWMASWYKPPTPSIYRLNPATGAVIASYVAPFTTGTSDGMAWSGLLWVGEEANRIYKIDPLQWAVLGTLNVPASGSSNPRDIGYDTRSGTIWAGYQSSGLVRQHHDATGAVIAEFPSPYGSFQQGVTWDGHFLWITGGSSNKTVSQVDVTPPFMVLKGALKGGTPIQFEISDAINQSGNMFIVGWSGSGTRGFPVGGKTVPLTFDNFTLAGLALVPWFQMVIDTSGIATTPQFKWPAVPPGIPFWVAGVTLGPSGLVSVTEPQKHVTQ
jgi:hypothetical protein